MGFNVFNIEDVSGNNVGGGPDGWIFEIDLWDHVDTVTGDFDDVNLNTGASNGEAADGYTYIQNDTTYGNVVGNTSDGTWVFYLDRAAVLASGTDQTFEFTITGFDGGDSDDDSVTINILICLCRNTLVDTPDGPRKVQDLRIGDMVSTADGDPVALQWVGRRKISSYELAMRPELRPIRISKNALEHGVPSRDLFVSPNHNVLIRDWRAQLLFSEAEVLVPAKALVNGSSIVSDMTVQNTEYFHLLFESHQIIWTEGAPTESFFPGPYSLQMLSPEARYQLLELFPELLEEDGYGAAARLCLTPKEGQVLRPDTVVEMPKQVAAA